jgi:hypothetical protein
MSIAIFAFALAAAQSAAPAAHPEKPQLICRESQRQLGSHIRSSRTCKTAEQWEAEDARHGAASLRVTEGQQDGRVVQQPH